MAPKLVRFGVSVETELLMAFDLLLESKGYATRSEALRDMMREYLIENTISNPDAIVMGTLTLLYTHSHGDLMHRLTDLQHDYHDIVVSSLHMHQDAHNCMEVLILKGKQSIVQQIADKLISTKGVKHGKLVLTTK